MPDKHRHDEETGRQAAYLFDYFYLYPQVGCVTVLVPPDIDQNLSSGDVTVAEVRRDTCHIITLLCNILTFREATLHCPVSRTVIRSKLSVMVMSVDFM